jgi:hypothetical protein
MITLSIILFISLGINVLLVWYCRRLTRQFVFFTKNVIELENKLNLFDTHLNSVYQLEMFYGDDTLDSLIKHSKDLVSSMKQFNDSFILEDEEGSEEEQNFEEQE